MAGAGNNIATELNTAVCHNNDFIYAICDSDKNYPEDKLGDTAEALIKEVESLKDLDNLHLDYHILEVCEKENLVKPTEYMQFHNIKELSLYLKMEKDPKMFHYLAYFDFKLGLVKKTYLENPQYYGALQEEYGPFVGIDELKEKEAILKGLGRTCLNKVNADYLKVENTSLDNYRNKIIKSIVTWGISIKKQKLV